MSRRDRFLSLQSNGPHVLPSLLLCDFGHLEREVRRLEAAGARALHVDVMDGHFVPNFTYGMPLVQAFRQLTELPLDVHLMIARPERYIQQFYDAGADALTIHIEAVAQPDAVLSTIASLGAATGIALNPATPLETVEACLDQCDMVLVMSVPAGFGGQSFHEVALEKLEWLQRHAPEKLLAVDGGINSDTIGRAAAAGAQLLVAGSAIFHSPDYVTAMSELQRLAVAG